MDLNTSYAEYNTTISWESNESIFTDETNSTISIDGLTEERHVELRATISRNGETNTTIWTDAIISPSDQIIVDTVLAALTIDTNVTWNTDSSINLPSSLYGANITWSSDNNDIVSTNGDIDFTTATQSTTLTATITSNIQESVTDTKEFVVTVQPDDRLIVADVNSSFTLATEVTGETLALETTGAYDSSISWATNDATVITSTGDVNLTTTDRPVKLTATITSNLVQEVSATKEFDIVVKASDALILEDVNASLDVNGGLVNVDQGFALQTQGNYDSTISWISNSGAIVINHDGNGTTITQTHENQIVTLTALISSGDINTSRSFDLNVSADPDMAAVYAVRTAYDTEYNAYTMDINTTTGYASIELNTQNDAGVTVTWTKDGNPTDAGVDSIASLITSQDVSYTATFVSNNYSETSTYNYTIPADTNRAIAFSSAGITGATTNLVNGSTREFSVVLEDGYGNVQAAKDVTFTATSGTINSTATTDVNGVATATFTATTVGSASVTASYGSELTANFNVITDPLAAYNLHGTIGTDTMVGIGNNYNADGVIVYSNGNILSDLGSPPNAAEAYFDINSNNKTIAINSLYVGREFAFVDGQQVYYVTVTAEHVGQYTSLISN